MKTLNKIVLASITAMSLNVATVSANTETEICQNAQNLRTNLLSLPNVSLVMEHITHVGTPEGKKAKTALRAMVGTMDSMSTEMASINAKCTQLGFEPINIHADFLNMVIDQL